MSAANPFRSDITAEIESPRYSGAEHRIAFGNAQKEIEVHVYAPSLATAILYAQFVERAVNNHAELLAAMERMLEQDEARFAAAEVSRDDVCNNRSDELRAWGTARNSARAAILKAKGVQS